MPDDLLVMFYKVSTAMVSSLNNQLRPYHVTFQHILILRYVERQTGEVIGKDICQYLGITHPTSVGLIARMVSADFISVKTSQKDRRQSVLSLTQHGKDILEQTQDIVGDFESKIHDELTISHDDLLGILSQLEKIFT